VIGSFFLVAEVPFFAVTTVVVLDAATLALVLFVDAAAAVVTSRAVVVRFFAVFRGGTRCGVSDFLNVTTRGPPVEDLTAKVERRRQQACSTCSETRVA
jgi:hypothetical protein